MFNPGDIVVRINENYSDIIVGREYVVDRMTTTERGTQTVLLRGHIGNFSERNFRLVQREVGAVHAREEIAPFAVGECVKLVSNLAQYPSQYIGTSQTITHVDLLNEKLYFGSFYAYFTDVERVTFKKTFKPVGDFRSFVEGRIQNGMGCETTA